ncbi:MAG: glycoside hydrolase family 15 protein [Candidatus Dormibacteria bacterium]
MLAGPGPQARQRYALRIAHQEHALPTRPTAPPIADHRVLGDGTSTALLRPDGEVDWWCAPELDSPPVLWSLLDPAGAAARWLEVVPDSIDGPPAGPSLHTLLRRGAQRVECWDALHCEDDRGTALIRLVRGLDGPLDLTHELALGGFDGVSWSDWEQAPADGFRVRLSGGELDSDGGRNSVASKHWLRTRLRAETGVWTALVVSRDLQRSVDVDVLLTRLNEAEAEEESLVARALLPRHFRRRADDALRVLRTCTYARTGAVAASATTSLPEAPGGDRQFDYRFSWLRDASLAVSVAALLGRSDIARTYLDFVLRQGADPHLPSGPMSDVRGEAVPAEREVSGVAGWAGSLPVRVGNAAADQVQYDALGLLVEAVSVHLQMGGRLDAHVWRLVRAVADKASDDPDERTSGIWEFRTPRALVSADIGRWIALDRAIWITRIWRPWHRRARWQRARRRLRGRVLQALDADGGLPQSYGDPTADASALMAVVFGLITPRDPRAGRLIDATVRELDCWPCLFRYLPSEDDGFTGLEGAFLPATFWLVAALARVGRVGEAIERMRALDAALPRLLAEEFEVTSGSSLGNVPLVWSHMEAARALYIIDAAVRRHQHGALALAGWRAARYLRVRARGQGRRTPPARRRDG